ncbi:MAG TPA: flagella basal body P-ring formation protein FlgA [Planctomycetaceae bacterium]|nr:flagella basal body P-ring formation protein FlgA [Planctomycetaceae bacterium]
MRFLILFSILSLLPVAAEGAEIVFHSTPVSVAGTVVMLGDIAEIDAGTHEDGQSLRQTLLFPAPEPGVRKSVRLLELRNILSDLGVRSTQHRIDGPERVVLIGAEETRSGAKNDDSRYDSQNGGAVVPTKPNPLRQAGNSRGTPARNTPARNTPSTQDIRVLESQVVAALKVYLDRCVSGNSQAGNSQEQGAYPWDIRIKLNHAQARALANGERIVTIYGGANPIIGPQQFEIEMESLDPATRRPIIVPVSAEVALPIEVLVLRRSVPKGHLLTEADVHLVSMLPEELKEKNHLSDSSPVVGQETLAPIREGMPITTSMVRPSTLIRKGDKVDVLATNGGIIIRLQGTAKQDGALGEPIQIEWEYVDPDVRNRKKEMKSFVAVVSDFGKATLNAGPSHVVR